MRLATLTAIFFAFTIIFAPFASAQRVPVKKGDSFWKIAKRYHVDFHELKEMNKDILVFPGNYHLIYEGQTMELPPQSEITKEVKQKNLIEKAVNPSQEAIMPSAVIAHEDDSSQSDFMDVFFNILNKVDLSGEKALLLFSASVFCFFLAICYLIYVVIKSYLDLKHSPNLKEATGTENVLRNVLRPEVIGLPDKVAANPLNEKKEALSVTSLVMPNNPIAFELNPKETTGKENDASKNNSLMPEVIGLPDIVATKPIICKKKEVAVITGCGSSNRPLCRVGYAEKFGQYFILPSDYFLFSHKFGSMKEIVIEVVAISKTLNRAIEELLEFNFESKGGIMQLRPLKLDELHEFQQAISRFAHTS